MLGGSSEIGTAIVLRLAQENQVEALLLGRDYKRMAGTRVLRAQVHDAAVVLSSVATTSTRIRFVRS